MDNAIVCTISMFGMNSVVVFPDNSSEMVPNKNIITYIPQVCHSENIYNVHFFGNKEYIDGLIEQMKEEEASNYALYNKINYEVN